MQNAGRNNNGHITTRHKGGGHKHHYRVVDFVRNKDAIPAKVERIEYDPNRSAHIALVVYADGERRYVIAPRGLEVGATILSGAEAPIKAGNTLPIRNIPVGSIIHCVEMLPGKGAQIARSAGAAVTLLAREGTYAQLRLRSGEVRKIHIDCRATIGEVSNEEHSLRQFGKAGAKRWRGIRPTVRGVAMNPVDHPHGGGEGRTGEGQAPVSPWNTLTKGLPHPQQQAHADDDRRASQEVRRQRHDAFAQEGPVHRPSPRGEGREGECHQGQEADQDLVAPLDDPARFHRAHDRRAQRQAAHSRVRDRPDGRPQARRVRARPRTFKGHPADKKAAKK